MPIPIPRGRTASRATKRLARAFPSLRVGQSEAGLEHIGKRRRGARGARARRTRPPAGQDRLSDRPAGGPGTDGAAGRLALVVRIRRRPLDQLFASRPGGADARPARRALGAAGLEPRLFHRLPHGDPGAPAIVHRNDDHRRPAPARGFFPPEPLAHGAHVGASSSPPILPERCSPRCSARSPRFSRTTSSRRCSR